MLVMPRIGLEMPRAIRKAKPIPSRTGDGLKDRLQQLGRRDVETTSVRRCNACCGSRRVLLEPGLVQHCSRASVSAARC